MSLLLLLGNRVSAYASAVLADSPWGFWEFAETSGTTLADSHNIRDWECHCDGVRECE